MRADRLPPRSEGEELPDFLADLERAQAIRDVSGLNSGFGSLNDALDGLLPGIHFLIGAPGSGKTSFAKQLLDQVAQHNHVPTLFFSFSESKHELRVRTLARLSGIDSREIRRGSAYLLHWYGMPRLGGNRAAELSPSWERVRRSAEEAVSWLSFAYIIECSRNWRVSDIDGVINAIADAGNKPGVIVIDDCQCLGDADQTLASRMPIISEQVETLASQWRVPLWLTWPDLDKSSSTPEQWSEKVPNAAVIAVIEADQVRQPALEPHHAVVLHIVKNRGGEKCKLAFDFSPGFARFSES